MKGSSNHPLILHVDGLAMQGFASLCNIPGSGHDGLRKIRIDIDAEDMDMEMDMDNDKDICCFSYLILAGVYIITPKFDLYAIFLIKLLYVIQCGTPSMKVVIFR